MMADPQYTYRPVGFLVQHESYGKDFTLRPLTKSDKDHGWTETQLYERVPVREGQIGEQPCS
jgi:hypothetical protein